MDVFGWLWRMFGSSETTAEESKQCQEVTVTPVAEPETLSGAVDDHFFDYLERTKHGSYCQGQLCFAPCVYPPDWPHVVVSVDNAGVPAGRRQTCMLKRYSTAHRSPPCAIGDIRLAANEQLLVSRGKDRLCVVLGRAEDVWPFRPPKKSQKMKTQKLCLVAPVFSLKQHHLDDDDFVIRVKGMQIPNLFYLPGDATSETDASVVRLEIVQPVSKGVMSAHISRTKDMHVKLSDAKYQALIRHLLRFVGFPPSIGGSCDTP